MRNNHCHLPEQLETAALPRREALRLGGAIPAAPLIASVPDTAHAAEPVGPFVESVAWKL